MGRINTVNLLGRVISEIEYRNDEETKELKSVKFALRVSRRQYANEDGVIGGGLLLSSPFILSRDEEIMKSMFAMCRGDIVIVKGNLCTRESERFICCENEDCDYEENIGTSNTIYIDPVFVFKIGHIEDDDKADKLFLSRFPEISNQILIEGRICSFVDYYADPGGKFRKCEYQIAVNRLRRIRADQKSKKTDYPWMISFGKQALSDGAELQTGSLITVNGAIMTVAYDKTHICPKCGAKIIEKRTETKVVPYNVEYRENCLKPESSHEETEDSDEEE